MDILTETADYQTIRVRLDDDICFIQIHRPEHNNSINDLLIDEFSSALALCEKDIKIVVVEGLPEIFCFGADFSEIQTRFESGYTQQGQSAGPLYDMWSQLASGPYVSVAHVRGKANAGGIGFVAACDIVLCDSKATFSLSELLFGLMPACVLPFLIRRVGSSKASYMTLTTQTVSAAQACEWGLVDACEENSENLLRKQLLRLRRLTKSGIERYKLYINTLDTFAVESKQQAIRANHEVFSDTGNLEKIARYVKTGKFPWDPD